METPEEMIARVRKMRDGYVDLSMNQRAALRYVLEQAQLAAQWEAVARERGEFLFYLWKNVPAKLDERLKYRELQLDDVDVAEMRKLYDATPASALAAHDREVRRKVLEEAAERIQGEGVINELYFATKLREMAEEGSRCQD